MNYASQHIPPEGVARGMTRFKLRIFAIVVPQWLGYHHPTSIAMDEHGSHKIKGVVPYLTPSAHDSGAACVQLRWVRSADRPSPKLEGLSVPADKHCITFRAWNYVYSDAAPILTRLHNTDILTVKTGKKYFSVVSFGRSQRAKDRRVIFPTASMVSLEGHR